MATQVTDDDIQNLCSDINDMTMSLEEFSIPYIPGLGSQSLLEKSQYGKVIFHEIQDSYPTDGDVLCKYTLTDGVCYTHGDRVNIYKVGWRQAVDFFHTMWAPPPSTPNQSEFQVLFKASNLPKDDQIYQFCYMTVNDEMCGASGPFQFHQPYDNDLCTVEESDGLVIVRSRSSLAEERLREARQTSLTLQGEKIELEGQLQEFTKMLAVKNKEKDEILSQVSALTAEKQDLLKRLDECAHLERHMDRVQKELQALDVEKNELQAKLQKAEAQIQALTASLESLTSDKENLSQQLCEVTSSASELAQLRSKLEDQQYTINVLTSSKEMITKELRLEISANEKHQNMVKILMDEKKDLEDKIKDFEKLLAESDHMLKEALQREKASIAQLDKLLEENKSLQEILSKDNQRESILAQELEVALAGKQTLEVALDELRQKIRHEKVEHSKEVHSLRKLMTQLAKDSTRESSLTQEREELKAEKQNLQRMLDASEQEKIELKKESTSHKELLEQLKRDSQHEVSLAQEIEQLRKANEDIQQALQKCQLDLQQEKAEQATKMEEQLKKHDGMLAELIRLTGKDKKSELQIAELSGKLREANEEVCKLQDLKTKSEDMKCLADVMLSRATLQRRVGQMEAEEKLSNKRQIALQERIDLLQKETIRLQSLVDASSGSSKDNCFGELFSCLEQQKCAVEAQLKEARECEQEQQDRQKTIAVRLEEISAEIETVNVEQQDVQQTYLTSNTELGNLREQLQTLKDRDQSSGFTVEIDDWATVSSPLELSRLEDEIRNAECFVESSHMRIMQLEQRQQELQQEHTVLNAQYQAAVERAQRHAEERKTIQRQLAAIEDSERIVLREHLDVVSSPSGAEGYADNGRDAVLSKLEDTAAITQIGSENAQELALRLKLAAAEYRKLYGEKQKADRRLRKLYQRLGDKQASTSSSSAEVPTAELVNISSGTDS